MDVVFGFQGANGDALFVSRAPGTNSVAGVAVEPSTIVLAGGAICAFVATVLGTGVIDQGVTWSTTLGTVDAAGVLLAPDAELTDLIGIVTATSTQDPSRSGSATFTITAVEAPYLESAPRFARPISDLGSSGWAPSSGNSLYAMLDEKIPDATDFISADGSASCTVALGPVADPGTSSGQVVRYEAHAPDGGSLTVTLKQGNTVIASRHHATLPATETMHELALSAEQCDSITDYRDLRVELAVA